MKKAGVATLGMIVVFAMGASSASAGDQLITVKAAKHKDGPYTGDLQNLNLAVGKSKTLYWRVKNIGDALTLELEFDDAATGEPEGYNIKWFKGKTNISADVKGAGYEFKLKPGNRKQFRATIKHKFDGDGNPVCLGGQANGPLTNADAAYFQVNGICT
jgi:hypothetical protein